MDHVTFPKPEPRGPKPKKRIARKSRPAKVRRTARGKANHAADLKWAKAVLAKGPCAAIGGWWLNVGGTVCGMQHRECAGRIDPAHVMSRRFLATRHDPGNGLPLCRRAHDWFTAHPKVWTAWLIETMGEAKYEALRVKALGHAFKEAA